MNQKTFSLTVGVLFLIFALVHLVRVAFGFSVVVDGFSIPRWASGIAVVISGYLAYEGLRRARNVL